jgi:hypothetical protein
MPTLVIIIGLDGSIHFQEDVHSAPAIFILPQKQFHIANRCHQTITDQIQTQKIIM